MLKRWWIYLNEVFLPMSRIVAVSIMVAAVLCLYQAMLGRAPLVLNWDAIPAAFTLVLILLYWRVQDEFKDAETDRKYFPHRPVPSGRVRFSDLRFMMWTIFAALFVVNLAWGLVIVPFLVLFVYSVLMHKWFFLEKYIASNRLLAFATHGPIGLVGNYFVLATFANRYQTPLSGSAVLVSVLWVALPGFAWEIARKTRAPHEEISGYQTYSAMIGSTKAAALSTVFVLTQCGLALTFPVSAAYLGVLITFTAVYVIWFVRFAFKPSIGSKSLRPMAEIYSLVSLSGLVADLAIVRGIVWNSIWP